MLLHSNPENASLHSGVEIATTSKKHDEKKGTKIKATKPSKAKNQVCPCLEKRCTAQAHQPWVQ